jgi:hypothetical protein
MFGFVPVHILMEKPVTEDFLHGLRRKENVPILPGIWRGKKILCTGGRPGKRIVLYGWRSRNRMPVGK